MAKKPNKKPTKSKKKYSKWVNFSNARTMNLKDKDIASGKITVDFKNYRWRRNYKR